MPSTWNVHYHRWVIDDGEPEREVGECFRWPVVAFGSSDPMTLATSSHVRSAVGVDDYSYEVVGQVVHVSSKAAVIDFGLRAVGASDSLPTGCQAGEYVAGRIKLFFQHWCHPLPHNVLESMDQEWSVESVLADSVPHRRRNGIVVNPRRAKRQVRTGSIHGREKCQGLRSSMLPMRQQDQPKYPVRNRYKRRFLSQFACPVSRKSK